MFSPGPNPSRYPQMACTTGGVGGGLLGKDRVSFLHSCLDQGSAPCKLPGLGLSITVFKARSLQGTHGGKEVMLGPLEAARSILDLEEAVGRWLLLRRCGLLGWVLAVLYRVVSSFNSPRR